MEDVLEVYQRPRDADFPLVCLDESSKQFLADTREPIPMEPGRPARSDYEYKRNGTANLFMVFAPLEGRRHVTVTDQRTAIDYAHMLKTIADELFPESEKIALVQDNLNTHKPASLYEGSIWPNRSLVSWLSSASTAECRTAKPSSRRSSPGNHIETNTTPKPIGSSKPKMRASS
jgi:hypothetical protein